LPATNDLTLPDLGAFPTGDLAQRSIARARDPALWRADPTLRQAIFRWSTNPYFLLEAGRIARQRGRMEEARMALERSKEFDPRSMRSIPSFRKVIIELTQTPGVLLCDVERDLRNLSPSGLLVGQDAQDPPPDGDGFFLDHCHPTATTNRQIAAMLDQTLTRAGLIPAPDASLSLRPLTRPDPDDIEEWLPEGTPTSLATRGHRKVQGVLYRDAEQLYLAALAEAPERPALWLNLGKILVATHNLRGALQAYQRFLELGGRDPIVEREIPLLKRATAQPVGAEPPTPPAWGRPNPPAIPAPRQPGRHRPDPAFP